MGEAEALTKSLVSGVPSVGGYEPVSDNVRATRVVVDWAGIIAIADVEDYIIIDVISCIAVKSCE